MKAMRNVVGKALAALSGSSEIAPDFEQDFLAIRERAKKFTMTSPERQYALYKATQYVVANAIQGDVVECGVWRGGSSMIVALALQHFGSTEKTLYLYDTFGGMSEPTTEDVDLQGTPSAERWRSEQKNGFNAWDYAPFEDVQRNMASTHYPQHKIVYVRGKVEDTIPATLPASIALLRLDTDWYESTRHELDHLFPLLVPGGVLLIDDYGHWAGAKKAVDEYLEKHKIKMYLNRIDYTGRVAIKIAP
jgi:O-methyltransferase